MQVLSLLIGAQTALAATTEVRHHTFLTVGEPSGSQVSSIAENGVTTVTFEFNDRGRGPETVTEFRLNDAGIPVSVAISGKNYRKGAVDERFTADGAKARWTSNIEKGEAAFDGSAFFMPNNAPPEFTAVLARALLADDDGTIPLLPNGTATIEELARRVATHEAGNKNIVLYGIKGLDTAPTYVWLDEQQQLFGFDADWVGITPRGYEKTIGVLKETQATAVDDFYNGLSKDLTQVIDGQLVIRGARLFDSIEGVLTEPATVFVWKGKISAVYFDNVEIPGDAIVIDGSGKTLLPGLWDMHAHIGLSSNFNYLASGVTHIRDMANDPEVISKLLDDLAYERIAGPDVYALGFIDKRGEYSAPTGRLVDSEQEAIAMVDYYAQRGFHGIKLYSSIEPQWVKGIAGYAHERDMVVMGHVPAYMNARQAVDAGYDEITHINMVLLNFLGAEELDTRTPTRFIVPGERARSIDLDSPAVLEFVQLLSENKIAVDPTLTIFLNMFLNEPGQVEATFRAIADHLPANVRRNTISGTGYNAGKEAAFAESAATTQRMVRLLHDSGVRLLPGTDNALPGFTLIHELMNYVDAGISAADTLQIATIEAARHLGLEDRLGSITVGKDAHLVLIDGDPLQDMSSLYRVEQVIKGRQMFDAAAILRAQGFRPFH